MFQKPFLILFGTISLSWTRVITQTSSDNFVTSKNYLLRLNLCKFKCLQIIDLTDIVFYLSKNINFAIF